MRQSDAPPARYPLVFPIRRRLPQCLHWYVDPRPDGSGVRSLRYLPTYVFRTAISNKRLVEVTERTVTFAYTDTKTGINNRITISGDEFLHRCSSIPLRLAVSLLEVAAGIPAHAGTASQTRQTRLPVQCPVCNREAALLY